MFDEAFPNELKEDLQVVLAVFPKSFNSNSLSFCSQEMVIYLLHGCLIRFPYRIYFDEIPQSIIDRLSFRQKEILYCIYSRSYDGYIREKYLKKLFNYPLQEWMFPFVVKLSDEYVYEIIVVIYNLLKVRNNVDLKEFCLENKLVIHKSYLKMVAYWNEFYRNKEACFRHYVGRKLYRECFGYCRRFEWGVENGKNKIIT